MSHLLLVRELLVFLGQNLGQIQVAHLRVDFGVFGAFLHEEAEVRSQRLLRKIWVSLFENGEAPFRVKGQLTHSHNFIIVFYNGTVRNKDNKGLVLTS